MEDDQSLPISDSETEVEVSDPESEIIEDGRNRFVLRLTPLGMYSFEDTEKFLDEVTDCYVLAEEVLPKPHFHIVLWSEYVIDEVRQLVTEGFLYHFWPKRMRGWGSAQYGLEQSTEQPDTTGMTCSSVSYALKDKLRYIYKGVTDEFIDKCLKESFTKNDPKNFRLEILKYDKLFQSNVELGIEDFMSAYIMLKAKYKQPVRVNDAYAHALSALIRREGEVAAESVVNNYLDRL